MRYRVLNCAECGARVAENWYIRHVRSGCQVAIRDDSPRQPLTPRQREIVRCLAYGDNNAIARRLGITENTVKQHIWDASVRLDVYASRTELLMQALRLGEVKLDELNAPAHVLARESRA